MLAYATIKAEQNRQERKESNFRRSEYGAQF